MAQLPARRILLARSGRVRVRIPTPHGVVRSRRAFAASGRTRVRRAAVVVLSRVVVVAPRVSPCRRRCAVRVRRARLLAAVCVCVRRLAGVLLQLLLAVVHGRVGLWRWEGLLATEGSPVSFRVILGFGLQKRREGVGRQVKLRSMPVHSGTIPQTQPKRTTAKLKKERKGMGERRKRKRKKHAHSRPHPTPVSS